MLDVLIRAEQRNLQTDLRSLERPLNNQLDAFSLDMSAITLPDTKGGKQETSAARKPNLVPKTSYNTGENLANKARQFS